LKAGGYLHLPKNTHHYEWSTEDTVIQLSGIGPVGMTYLDPSDDPRKNAWLPKVRNTTASFRGQGAIAHEENGP
jgi:hypothetical protein